MSATSKTVQQANADTFSAIAHPVRRQILDRLTEGEQSVSMLAEPFGMSRPAISQHLRILREVGLVTEQRHGREHHYRLQPERLYEVEVWMQKYQRFWLNRLEALGGYLERTHEQR